MQRVLDSISVLTNVQNTYEQRFNCPICLCPKLKMVYGSCQHRICQDCLYDADDIIRQSLQRCPSCQKEGSFPDQRPDIPDDNIELQKCLGMRVCVNGCDVELWEWEIEEHVRVCPKRIEKVQTPSREKRSVVNLDPTEKKRLRSCRLSTRSSDNFSPSPLRLRSASRRQSHANSYS
ncbi:hypothetical protein ScPMuIL_014157 [Solemya velum]